ncbi:MAG: MarR family transcriptional regulator [Caulobacteraceae bacterium]|nr:MarR family transcriptional regulator [Caulobacteraceae bacterium]
MSHLALAPDPRSGVSESDLVLDDYLPFRLSVASNGVSRLIARAYEDRFGLTIPQWRLMAVLAEGGLTQQAVVARTAMDKVTVSRAARELVSRGLLGRDANMADGRSHLLVLTPIGSSLYAEIAPLAKAYEAALLTGLAPNEVATLKRLLLRLEAAAARLSGDATAR